MAAINGKPATYKVNHDARVDYGKDRIPNV